MSNLTDVSRGRKKERDSGEVLDDTFVLEFRGICDESSGELEDESVGNCRVSFSANGKVLFVCV